MSDQIDNDSSVSTAAKRKRNIVLALILGAAVLVMYLSIFYRLSVNPLG